MKKHFYSHVVETASISLALAEMDMSNSERKHLIDLVEANLHHAILDAVLSELSEKDKQEFVELYAEGNDEKIWKLLDSRVENIEDKIKKTAKDVKKELHKDIEESKIKSKSKK
jgi:5,10-methenyltetrahydromethanopterin hydrogenase